MAPLAHLLGDTSRGISPLKAFCAFKSKGNGMCAFPEYGGKGTSSFALCG